MGKSTQAARLASFLHACGSREPGGTVLGERIRTLLLGSSVGSLDVRAELYLILAARAQHVSERIRPMLTEGNVVVVDRFSGSTLAYQGFGRGLPLDVVRRQCDIATGGLWPDLTILLDLAVDEGVGRRSEVPDRIERETTSFHDRVRKGYLELARDDPSWVVVDASPDVDAVAQHIAALVQDRLELGAQR